MKKYSPGANIKSDYCHICDCCEIDDGRPVLIWEPLPKRRGHFALCTECLKKLALEHCKEPGIGDPTLIVSCDCCEIDDGRLVLIWEPLPKRRGHFALCTECLKKLALEHCKEPGIGDPTLIVSRLVISEALRNKIFARDGYKCCKCGSVENLQLDHIIPFSKGGITEEGNLQTLCGNCNLRKRNKRE